MKNLTKLIYLLLLLVSMMYVKTISAQQMKVESVFVEKFQTPILKGKAINSVLQIKIETSGKKKPLALREVSLEILGSDIQNDIEETSIFFTAGKPFLQNGIQFGISETPQKSTSISGNQQLNEGTNIFHVSIKLSDNANILNEINTICGGVKINNKFYIPKIPSSARPKKLGVALRKHNDDGVHTCRIPGLATTNKGTLIAVYDIRRNNATDLQEDIDVGMNRSTDGGKTWEPMKIIMDMGEWGGLPNLENGIGDPSILVDRETNTIWVAAVWAHGHPGKRNWVASKQGMEPTETSQFILVKSEDDGLAWSEPINITSQIKDPKWHLLLQDPGKGITLKDGTLVFPAQFKDENEVSHSTIIFSKDHGETWQIGTGAKPKTTESQVIELNDESLMLNMRNYDRSQKSRKISFSDNGGLTWSDIQSDNALIEPICQASLIFSEENQTLYFLNPASENSRTNMTLKSSADFGKTWKTVIVMNSGASAYSDLTLINKNTLGCLYEGGMFSPYEGIVFTIVKIE